MTLSHYQIFNDAVDLTEELNHCEDAHCRSVVNELATVRGHLTFWPNFVTGLSAKMIGESFGRILRINHATHATQSALKDLFKKRCAVVSKQAAPCSYREGHKPPCSWRYWCPSCRTNHDPRAACPDW